MKTTLVLLGLIILNTSALLSEPLATLVKGIDTWVFVVFEVLLLIVLFAHNTLKGLRCLADLDLSDIQLFVVRAKNTFKEKP